MGGIAGIKSFSRRTVLPWDQASRRQLWTNAVQSSGVRRKTVSPENIPACTDTGGIAGYSKGTVQGCTNRGTVGYPHTGYNVGGIVGRQSGIVPSKRHRAMVPRLTPAMPPTARLVPAGATVPVTVRFYTGGISGENYGSIVRCTNEARVNTQEAEVFPSAPLRRLRPYGPGCSPG